MSWMFVVTVVGGVVGLVLPNLEFTSLVEAVLPGALRSNKFISILVHPAAASFSSVLGVSAPRPIAPFTFANAWALYRLVRQAASIEPVTGSKIIGGVKHNI